jgi:superfamily II DNA/RNA helicase
MKFSDLNLEESVLQAIEAMNFQECTPVQEHTIPVILEGHDLIGVAQTGTGKTAAYLLPILTLLQQEEHPKDAVNCLIMAPTRELARQIDQAMQGFAFYMNISSVAIYGGNDGIRYEQERKSLLNGADIVIATPGRLITHLQLGTLDLSKTSHFILDEADRMLDMGFADDIKTIV